MQSEQQVIDCYNKTAKNYAEKYKDELVHKHFDQFLLTAFAAENSSKGNCIDLGCGPGQTTQYLSSCGWKEIVGTDISDQMIAVAKNLNPAMRFETANMLQLPYDDNSFAAAIAFYSIVHFDYTQMIVAFKEINRILKPQSHFLFSFHLGNETVHLDEFLDQPVNIDFYFYDATKIIELLSLTDFEIIDVLERQHYPGIEYASKRAYLWVKKK